MTLNVFRFTGLNSSLALKAPVRCASTVNLTLAGLQTIDGVVLQSTDTNLRVLVKNQADPRQNGLYDAQSGNWTRCTDWDTNDDFVQGTRVFVTQGATQPTTTWYLSTADPVTLGTSNITFTAVPIANAAFADGTVGNPSINFAADLTTGFYRPGASQIGVTLGGVAAATFTLSGLTLVTPLALTYGGTGAATLTAHGVLVGEGTNAIAATAAGTSGVPLIGQGGGADPVFGTAVVAGGGTSATTAAGARGATGLNVESGTGRGDANYPILATDRFVFTNAAFTTARTFTLPAASAVNPGAPLVVADVQGTVTLANTLSLAPNGTDKIDGVNATLVALRAANEVILLWSDGVANWKTTGALPSSSSWITYTPTVTAGSGTFTSVSATGRFKQIGKSIFFSIGITITTNGSAATNVQATLPIANPVVGAQAIGQEVNNTGKSVIGFIISGGTTVSCRFYDNTYPGSDGAGIVVNGVYETP